MTVGRSEQANTFVVERDLNVLSIVGWVPRVTFFLSESNPVISTKIQTTAINIISGSTYHLQNEQELVLKGRFKTQTAVQRSRQLVSISSNTWKRSGILTQQYSLQHQAVHIFWGIIFSQSLLNLLFYNVSHASSYSGNVITCIMIFEFSARKLIYRPYTTKTLAPTLFYRHAILFTSFWIHCEIEQGSISKST